MYGLKFAESLQFYQSGLNQLKKVRNRNVKYKSLQNSVFKLLYHFSAKRFVVRYNNLDLPLKIFRQGFNEYATIAHGNHWMFRLYFLTLQSELSGKSYRTLCCA